MLDCIDYERSGYFTIKQLGQILAIFKVFKVLFCQNMKSKTVGKTKGGYGSKAGANSRRNMEMKEEERQ